MNATTTSENTPLLTGTQAGARNRPSLPPLKSTVRRVQRLETTQFTLPDLCPDELMICTDATRTAYALLVLLLLRTSETEKSDSTKDVWDSWSKEQCIARDAQELELRILDFWTQFLKDYRSPRDIEDVLWLGFLVEEGCQRVVRVVDLLSNHNVSDSFLSHRVVYLSLLRTWKYGRIVDGESNMWRRFDAACTPRISHCIELLFQLAYLIVLLHFLLYPPMRPIVASGLQDNGVREIVLIFSPITALARVWSSRTIPILLVFLAFASCLPSVPDSGDPSFGVLLVAFSIHIWQLHLPSTPSPIFILPIDRALPLCTLLWHTVSRAISPVFMFFFPVLLLTWFLMYFSLADTFFNVYGVHSSPIDTRVAFALLFGIELLILIPFLFVPVLIFPTLSSAKNESTLDRYSVAVGLDARKAFLRAVVAYSSPYYFPPPLNVLGLFVQMFSIILQFVNLPLNGLEKILWRVAMGPVTFIIAFIWIT